MFLLFIAILNFGLAVFEAACRLDIQLLHPKIANVSRDIIVIKWIYIDIKFYLQISKNEDTFFFVAGFCKHVWTNA